RGARPAANRVNGVCVCFRRASGDRASVEGTFEAPTWLSARADPGLRVESIPPAIGVQPLAGAVNGFPSPSAIRERRKDSVQIPDACNDQSLRRCWQELSERGAYCDRTDRDLEQRQG